MDGTRHKAIQSKLEPAAKDIDRYAGLGQSKTSDDREQFSELLEGGIHQGRPLFGLTVDGDGETLVPGSQYHVAVRTLKFRDVGYSYQAIAGCVDPSQSNAYK